MSTCYIQEYRTISNDAEGNLMPAGHEDGNRSDVSQAITFSSTPGTSLPFQKDTRHVRIWVDATAHIAFGVLPNASADDMPIASSVPEYWGVKPGHRLSVVAD